MISRKAFWVTIAIGSIYLLGISQAQAHHSAPPRAVATIERIYPDLHARVLREKPVSWARLRAMAAHRWRALHPAAERRHARLELEAAYRREADRYRAALMCIAGHESHWTWDISTGNGYYGGLQMDRTFQRGYGLELYIAKGTADNWTRDEQIAVASRAVPRRGFHPWPNTARMCGLL